MAITVRAARTADLTPPNSAPSAGCWTTPSTATSGTRTGGTPLGGVHALVSDGRGLAGHGAVVMRRVRYRGRWVRTGYAEGAAVRREVRRTGIGGRVMAVLEEIVTRAYAFGALSASEDGVRLYEARGRRVRGGQACAPGPDGVVRLREEEGAVYVWPAVEADVELVFDWRDGDVLRADRVRESPRQRGVTHSTVSDSRKTE